MATGDFGHTVEKIRIWQNKFQLDRLISIQLEDDVRGWDIKYQPSLENDSVENVQALVTFDAQRNVRHRCHIYPRVTTATIPSYFNGINTMKQTTQECYNTYTEFLSNSEHDEKGIVQVRIAPVYYILAPSSCYCGSSNISTLSQCNDDRLEGTIMDPDVPNRIHLACVSG
jgi:hypothetical protein